jgi:hypothetical protein
MLPSNLHFERKVVKQSSFDVSVSVIKQAAKRMNCSSKSYLILVISSHQRMPLLFTREMKNNLVSSYYVILQNVSSSNSVILFSLTGENNKLQHVLIT